MKIAILSSASAGGAGIAAFRMYQAFLANSKHEVDFIDMNSFGAVDNEVSPPISATNDKITNTHFTIDYASDARQWVVDFLVDYDLINVQWASYLVSLSEIQMLAKLGKKILFTLHDFYYITGGCHYPAGCTGFMRNCVACPQVNEAILNSKTVVATNKLKREIFSFSNVQLSAPSQFIVDNAIQSGIVPARRAHVIRNAYQPLCEFEHKRELVAEKSILLIADSFDEQRKGLTLAVDSLKLAARDFNKNNSKVTLHLVGGLDAEVIKRLNGSPLKIVTHGHIKDHRKLVDIFNQCHFILSCSYEDNWPNILVESGSYGCIPIVGKWHGCEEFVNELALGFVADNYSAMAFSRAINEAVCCKIPTDAIESFVRRVRTMHSPRETVNSYLLKTNLQELNQNIDKRTLKNHSYLSLNYLFSTCFANDFSINSIRIDFAESPFGSQEKLNETIKVQTRKSLIENRFLYDVSILKTTKHYGIQNLKLSFVPISNNETIK